MNKKASGGAGFSAWGGIRCTAPQRKRLARKAGMLRRPGRDQGRSGGGNDLKFRPQFSEVWLMKSVFGEDKIEGQRRKNR